MDAAARWLRWLGAAAAQAAVTRQAARQAARVTAVRVTTVAAAREGVEAEATWGGVGLWDVSARTAARRAAGLWVAVAARVVAARAATATRWRCFRRMQLGRRRVRPNVSPAGRTARPLSARTQRRSMGGRGERHGAPPRRCHRRRCPHHRCGSGGDAHSVVRDAHGRPDLRPHRSSWCARFCLFQIETNLKCERQGRRQARRAAALGAEPARSFARIVCIFDSIMHLSRARSRSACAVSGSMTL